MSPHGVTIRPGGPGDAAALARARRPSALDAALHDAPVQAVARGGSRGIELCVLGENRPARASYEARGWRLAPGERRHSSGPVEVRYAGHVGAPRRR